MKPQDMTLQQLKEIVEGAPEGAEYFEKDTSRYLKVKDIRSDYSQDTTTLLVVWCSNGWTDATLSYSKVRLHAFLTKLSDIRARIEKIEAQKDINVTLSAGSIENKGFDGSEKPEFKVGDRVVYLPSAAASVTKVFEVVELHGKWCSAKANGALLDRGLSYDHIRHATPAEIAAGHRIDEPSSSCGMTGAEIDQFGEDLRSKLYVDFPEFEQPDTITTQLDPAKCRVVDPALPYDEPAKRRVGWVGCLGFGAIGDALQGNQSNFDAMSEKHRSPSCKCQEFPIDAELKAPAGMKHDQSKPRYSLIPAGALEAIVGVLEYGATKYAPDNWKHVENARERYYNASMRHIQSWWTGEQNDPETGLPHLAHAVCSLMFLMALKGEQGE